MKKKFEIQEEKEDELRNEEQQEQEEEEEEENQIENNSKKARIENQNQKISRFLLKKGIKQFSLPDPSDSEQTDLHASSLSTALQHWRTRLDSTAQAYVESKLSRKKQQQQNSQGAATTMAAAAGIARGEWDESRRVVRITVKKGKMMDTIGYQIGQTLFLFPEEALFVVFILFYHSHALTYTQTNDSFLIERGNLLLFKGEHEFSVQDAFNLLLSLDSSSSGISIIHRFFVYAHLKKAGFVVRIAQGDRNATDSKSSKSSSFSSTTKSRDWWPTVASELGQPQQQQQQEEDEPEDSIMDELEQIDEQNHKKYLQSLQSRLNLVLERSQLSSSSSNNNNKKPSIDLHVHKTTKGFSRVHPGTPDFVVCIVPSSNSIPSLSDMESIQSSINSKYFFFFIIYSSGFCVCRSVNNSFLQSQHGVKIGSSSTICFLNLSFFVLLFFCFFIFLTFCCFFEETL